MLPWAVRNLRDNVIVGSTRYHGIIPEIDGGLADVSRYTAPKPRGRESGHG
jgi:hypothetical protein